jgi:hypothetical protein
MKNLSQNQPELPGRSSRAKINVADKADAAGASALIRPETEHQWLGERSSTGTEELDTRAGTVAQPCEGADMTKSEMAQYETTRRP